MAKIIDGNKIAKSLKLDLAKNIAKLPFMPTLAVILSEHNPSSCIYVDKKIAACEEVGIRSLVVKISPNTKCQEEVEKFVKKFNNDPEVDGILVQLPLPDQVDKKRIFSLILPAKDVDALTPHNVGLLTQGNPAIVPCTPQGIALMFSHEGLSVEGKHVVVINRSDIVGKPLFSMLIRDNAEFGNATVTLCHVKTPPDQLKKHCLNADVIMVAVGIPGFLTSDMVREGQIIVDIGINRVGVIPFCRVVGDVAEGVAEKVSYITKVPGGVGPLTIASLLFNTVHAATMRRGFNAHA